MALANNTPYQCMVNGPIDKNTGSIFQTKYSTKVPFTLTEFQKPQYIRDFRDDAGIFRACWSFEAIFAAIYHVFIQDRAYVMWLFHINKR